MGVDKIMIFFLSSDSATTASDSRSENVHTCMETSEFPQSCFEQTCDIVYDNGRSKLFG